MSCAGVEACREHQPPRLRRRSRQGVSGHHRQHCSSEQDPGRGPGGRSGLPGGRPLVEHDHRHRPVHRLRQLRASVQGGKRRPVGALLLPDVGGALPRARRGDGAPPCRLSQRRISRFPGEVPPRRWFQELLRSQALQPLYALPVRPGVPGGGDLSQPRRRGSGRQGLLPGLPLLRAGVPLRVPLHRPENRNCRQVHAVLPPHHERPDHRLLRDLSHRCPHAG